MTVLHAGGKFDGKSYGVSGGLHGVGVTVVNALSTRLDVQIWTNGTEWHQTYTEAKPGPLEEIGPTTKRGTAITFWADPSIFETTTYSFDTISRRLQEMAFLNKGLTIIVRDERPGQSKAETGLAEEISVAEAAPAADAEKPAFEPTEVTYLYEEGDQGLRRLPQPDQEPDPPLDHRLLRRRCRQERHRHVGRRRDAVVGGLLRVGAHLREHHQHPRGRHPRGGLPRGADLDRQPVRRGQEALQGQGREAHRRGHPRGPGRDRLGQARRPAVRGPDEDQARQHRGEGLRPAGLQRADRALVRGEPDRGQADHHQGELRRARPPGRPAGPPAGPQEPARTPRACRASSPTAARPTRATPRSTSSRATRPAARRSPAATRCSRRSCPSAARSSTSRRRASTGCSRTPRSSR